VRKHYSDLDLPTSGARGRGNNKGDSRRQSEASSQQRRQQQQQQQGQQQQAEGESATKLSLGQGVMLQLQFMCTGAMALVVMTFTANLTADQPKFYRELAALPLQAGKSPYCHAMCPDVVQQLQQMRMTQTIRIHNNSHSHNENDKDQESDYVRANRLDNENDDDSNSDNDDNDNHETEGFETSELLQDPVTEELESMLRMVHHCQQRMALEQKLRLSRGIEQDSNSNQIVDIPAPGVPPNYLDVLSSVEGGGGSDGDGDGGDNDDENDNGTAHGDDWAKGLVMDREDK
jgi:hypothetical protein